MHYQGLPRAHLSLSLYMVGFIFEPEGKVLGIVLGRAGLPKGGRPSIGGSATWEYL